MDSKVKLTRDDDEEEEEEEKTEEDFKFLRGLSLEEKLKQVLEMYKVLVGKLRGRDATIRKLRGEVERRDKILELCSNPQEDVEVLLDMTAEGDRSFEIRNKQKIPYWIKTERLSPIPAIKDEEDWREWDGNKIVQKEMEVQSSFATEPSMELDALSDKTFEDEKPQNLVEEELELELEEGEILEMDTNLNVETELEPEPEPQPEPEMQVEINQKEEEEESDENVFEPISPSTSTATSLTACSSRKSEKYVLPPPPPPPKLGAKKRRASSSSSSPTSSFPSSYYSDSIIKIKRRRTPEQDTKSMNIFKKRRESEKESRRTSLSIQIRVSDTSKSRRVFPEDDDILERATSEFSEKESQIFHPSSSFQIPWPDFVGPLPECKFDDDFDQNFFWPQNDPEKNSEIVQKKYRVKFHDDRGDWQHDKWFTLVEKSEDAPPQIRRVKFQKLKQILGNPNEPKLIYLDVRDFNLFSHSTSSTFNFDTIGSAITHFSLGSRLYSFDNLRATLLLDFIFRHLPNLEYLSIDNGMLCRMDSTSEPRVVAPLVKLKTIRLIRSSSKLTSEFTSEFLQKILKTAPNLQNLYGIPIHILNKSGTSSWINWKGVVRSIGEIKKAGDLNPFIRNPNEFLAELTQLSSSCLNLHELDTRTFFIKRPATRVLCVQKISNILEKNSSTLQKLVVEAQGPRSWLKIPRLKNLTTLQFHLCQNLNEITSFFPKEFDSRKDWANKFPGLKEVEIYRNSEQNLDEREAVGQSALTLFEKNFPPTVFTKDVFTRVEKLSLWNLCDEKCLQKISRLFPNIKALRLHHQAEEVASVLPLVFKTWRGVQQLVLEIDTGANLDTSLTGIDKDAYTMLRRETMETLEGRTLQNRVLRQRINPSVCNLTELKLLKFVLRPAKNLDRIMPVISPLAAIFGFGKQLMPELSVQLSFDEQVSSDETEILISTLLPLLPFITFDC